MVVDYYGSLTYEFLVFRYHMAQNFDGGKF